MKKEKNKHVHHGKSTRDILDPGQVLLNVGIKPGDIFVDAGCGDGFISLEASKMVGEKGMVYAVDIHDKSLESLEKEIQNKKSGNISLLLADITRKLPLEDDSVDIYFMANVFHGLVSNNEVTNTMKESLRILKPGGILAIVDFKKVKNTPGPPLEVRLEPEEIVETLLSCQLQEPKIIDTGPYHYLVLASSR
ncbi:methyltransferase domain-containing protein [Methanobacterium movens]